MFVFAGGEMLTRRFLNIYGIIGIIVMTALLFLVLFRVIPELYYLPVFAVAFVIWVSRMAMRVLIVRRERRAAERDVSPPATDPGHTP